MGSELQRFPADTLRRYTIDILACFGVPPADGAVAADALVQADLMGFDSHGVARLHKHPGFVPGLRSGLINPRPTPREIAGKPAIGLLDGDNGLGVVVATRAMQLAIERASDVGVGAVAVTNTHHLGIGSHYTLMAVERGMIGIATTNGSPQLVPTFGRRAMLGTNPLSIAAPAGEERPFLLDMAASVVAAGKVEIAMRTGKPIPDGWIVAADGQPSRQASDLWNGGALLPLGSTPELGSYKGYGLGVAMDVLSGVLSGAGYSATLDPTSWSTGHFMLAIDVAAIRALPVFALMMDAMIRTLHQTPPVGDEPVRVPGERALATRDERRRLGVPLHPVVMESLRALAIEANISSPF